MSMELQYSFLVDENFTQTFNQSKKLSLNSFKTGIPANEIVFHQNEKKFVRTNQRNVQTKY